MFKTVLMGWFLISTGDKDGDRYTYLLEDRANNIHVSLTTKQPLVYPVMSWGKFKMSAECNEVKTSNRFGDSLKWVNSTFCSADEYKIPPCRRGMNVGGVTYCE